MVKGIWDDAMNWQVEETDVLRRDGLVGIVIEQPDGCTFYVLDEENHSFIRYGSVSSPEEAKRKIEGVLEEHVE